MLLPKHEELCHSCPMFLILANLPSQLVEFRRFAAFLQRRGEFVRLLVEGDHLLSEPGAELLPSAHRSEVPMSAKLAEWVSNSKFPRIVFSAMQDAKAEFQSNRPKCLIVGEDGVGGNLAWISVARSMGIPVVILPYEYSGVDQVIQAIRPSIQDYRADGVVGRAFSLIHPRWVREIDGQKTLRLPLRFALGYEFAGVAPHNPWTVHGGRAHMLLAESTQMADHYDREGLPKAKIAVTGSLAFDDLYESLQTATAPGTSLRILCALPPDYTEARGPMPYSALVSHWLNQAQKHGSVTVQAHPSARKSLENIGVEFDTRDITTLIAENDLLITSVSSIIRFALAARRPVLNFDCYRFNYPDYVDAAGCVTVETLADFDVKLAEICYAIEPYRIRAAADAQRWGVVDGKAANRIATALGLRS